MLFSQDFLPSLRHIYVRLRHICPKILMMIHGNHDQLATITINLSLDDACQSGQEIQSRYCARYCRRLPGKSIYPPDIGRATSTAFSRLPALKVVLILAQETVFPRMGYDVPFKLEQSDVEWTDCLRTNSGACHHLGSTAPNSNSRYPSRRTFLV